MYKITATIHKNGQAPTNWTRTTDKKVTKTEAIEMLDKSHKDSYGHGLKNSIKLENFECVRV